MRVSSFLIAVSLCLSFTVISIQESSSQALPIAESDAAGPQLIGFFDLRERESFMQLTNTDSAVQTVHIQLFNVNDNCNENNFFDDYTANDTHIYNLRDIQTNDGNPPGVVLPADAYGIFVATYVNKPNVMQPPLALVGNLRVIDNSGYEYRTNLLSSLASEIQSIFDPVTFNFNSEAGVTLSDVIGIPLDDLGEFELPAEVFAADVTNIWLSFDVNILDNIENIFSCRDITFACVNDQNPLLEELLAASQTSVASFEYGINNAIPHSKGGELLCPGNTISEGVVTLTNIDVGFESQPTYFIFVGLNNGNGRGSLDVIWNDQIPDMMGGG